MPTLAIRARASVAPVVLVAVTVLGVPACSSSSDEAYEPRPPTPWERELANVDENGNRSLESALRLFAIAFGPIPGVDAPTGPHELIDATIAIEAVRSHEADLTGEQRAAVEAAVQPPRDADVVTIPPVGEGAPRRHAGGGGRRRGVPSAAPRLQDAYPQVAELARRRLARRLGFDFPGLLEFTQHRAEGNYAYTSGRWGAGGYTGCGIVFDPAMNTNPATGVNTVFHEVLHCFQQSVHSTPAEWTAAYAAKWVFEGSSEWAAGVLVGPDESTADRWHTYLHTPRKQLFARDYDAIGFFSHLAEAGIDPWSVLRSMYVAARSGSLAAYDASGARGAQFVDSWGPGYVREPARGRAWDTTGPGIPNTKLPPKVVRVDTGVRDFTIPKLTVGTYKLDVTTDIVHVQVSGHARLSDGRLDTNDLADARFCVRAGGCVCPDEKQGDGSARSPGQVYFEHPKRVDITGQPVLAVTGAVDGTAGSVQGESLREFCGAKASRTSGRHLVAIVDRPALEGGAVHPLRVAEVAACRGVFGLWSGVLRTGGVVAEGGYEIPVADIPISFTMPRSGVVETVVTIRAGIEGAGFGSVDVPLTVRLIDRRTLSIQGEEPFPNEEFAGIPITRAPGGTC